MIHQIRIQNFKSLRDVTVELSPVTVFVGKSGTGKTNFASAIKFLRDCLATGPGQAAQHCPNHKCMTNPSGAIRFEAVFSVPEFSERFVYTLNLNEQHAANLPREESLAYGSRVIFKQVWRLNDNPQWEIKPGLVSALEPGALALGRLPGLEEAAIAHTALTAAVGVYSFPYDVLVSKTSGQNGAAGFSDKGDNYLVVLGAMARDLQKGVAVRKAITATLRRINETVAGVELDSLQNPQNAIVAHRLGDKTLPLELQLESDGFRRFYAHLLALYQMPPKQTLVFEEPENGIYPGALELLADAFKAAPDDNRGQVLLTTHSPALLDHFSADQIRVVELENLETRIGPLAEEQKQALKEELLHAGELLTVDPARRQGT
jgi:predicted ATP-dependent endonuclease of OLD family